MKFPLVSVIITTKGRLKLLKRAVESVQSQSYEKIEIIVVDDDSTDGTQEWCEKQNFNYVRIAKSNSKNGNYARNVGFEISKGEYIAFLDDDDAWLEDKIEKQVRMLLEYNADLVYTLRKFEVVSSSGITIFDEKFKSNLVGDLSKKILLVECVTSTSSLLFSRDLFQKVGKWDEQQDAWQDNELLIRCAQVTDFYCVNECLTIYRINDIDNKKISNNYYKWKRAADRLYDIHKQLYSKLNLFEKYKVKSIYHFNCAKRAKASNLKTISFLRLLILYIYNPLYIIKMILFYYKKKR